MEITLATLALLMVLTLPFTVLKPVIQKQGDLLHPLRLIAILSIVSTVPFLLATAMDPETVSRPTRMHPSVPNLTDAVLWYILVQAGGYLCLLAGYLYPKKFARIERLPRPGAWANVRGVWVLGGLSLFIGVSAYLFILFRVGGVAVLLAKMQSRSELLAGNNYAVSALGLLSVGVCAVLLTNRFGVKAVRVAAAVACFVLVFLMFSTLGGRLNAIRLALLMILTWHYGVKPFRRVPKTLIVAVMGVMVPFFFIMPLFRNPRGAALYIENPNRLLPDLQKQFASISKQTSYVESYILITSHFNPSNIWLGKTYEDLLYGPIPSSMMDGKPPLDDGVYIRTLYDGKLNVQPGTPTSQLDASSLPPETLGAMYMNFWIPGVLAGMFLLGACYRFAYEYMMRSGRTLYSILIYGQALVMLQFSNLRIVQCLTTFVILTAVFMLVERRKRPTHAVVGLEAAQRVTV